MEIKSIKVKGSTLHYLKFDRILKNGKGFRKEPVQIVVTDNELVDLCKMLNKKFDLPKISTPAITLPKEVVEPVKVNGFNDNDIIFGNFK